MIKIYYLHRGDDTPFYIGYTKHLKNRLNGHRRKKGNEVEMVEIDECLEEDKKMAVDRHVGESGNKSLDLMKRLTDYLDK